MPSASSEFLIECLESEISTDAAKTKFIEVQQKEIEEQKAKNVELEASLAVPGATNVPAGAGSDSDKVTDPCRAFDVAIRKEMSEMSCDRFTALQSVAKRDPELHKAFLLATNKGSTRAEEMIEMKAATAAG
jgi:hypothetical protein